LFFCPVVPPLLGAKWVRKRFLTKWIALVA
jgi:hypothetical protein